MEESVEENPYVVTKSHVPDILIGKEPE